MSWKGRFGWGTAGLLIVAALVYGFLPEAVAVDAAAVRVGPLEVGFTEEGKTRVIDRFILSAPVTAALQRIQLDVGDPVEAGQTLCRLLPVPAGLLDARSRAEAEQRLAAARAAHDEARERVSAAAADQDYWEAELTRQADLVAKDVVSKEQFERAQAQARRAAAELRSARFAADVARYEVELARSTLDFSPVVNGGEPAETLELRSPVDGAVLKLFRESEGVVQAGESLLEVGDPDALEIEVEVLSRDAVQLRPGMPVRFERWGGEKPIPGRVRRVEPVGFTKISALGVEEQRVLVIADFDPAIAEAELLGDGYRVEGTFILWSSESVLQIPTSALFESKGGWAVFVIENGRAAVRPVQIGHRSGLATQVLSGIEEGEWVIAHPDETIEDGIKVEPR